MKCFLSVLLILTIFGACSANMIPNSSFEDSTLQVFTFNSPGSALDSTQAHSGKSSIRAKDSSTFSSKPVNFENVSDKPRRIAVSAWVKAEKVIPGNQGWKSGRLIVWARDKDGEAIKIKGESNDGLIGDFGAGFAGTFDWTQFKGTFVIPPGVASITLECGLSLASGTAWFDDLCVEEIPLEWQSRESSRAHLTIDCSSVSRHPVVGIGWNWEFVWGPPYEMSAPDDFLRQLFKFAKWDQQSFVRFGYLSQYCMKDDLRKSAPEFNENGENAQFYKKVLTGLKDLDITLLACDWFYGDASGGYKDPPYPADRFVESAAEVLARWVKTDGFTNIKYASLWNEPCWSYPGKYPEDFFTYTRELDKRLREHGVRSQVKIMGSDSTESGAAAEFRFPRYNRILGEAADAFAFHDYGSGIEAPGQYTSSGILEPYLKSYKAASGALGDKPLFMSEFGTGATGDEATYRGTLANTELVIGGLNNGVTAFSRWAYNCLWDTSIGYSPFTVDGANLQPHRSVYYPYAILTKAIRPGMRVVSCNLQDGRDSAGYQRVHASALAGDNGAFALIIVNDGTRSKTIEIDGLPKTELHHYFYDSKLSDGLQKGKSLIPGAQYVTIQPMSVNALVSWQWKELKPLP